MVAAVIIDRLVHGADVLTLTGESYRSVNTGRFLAKENRAADDQR
ncbi:hypothetical protein [Mycolicibacterium novocastrense]|nr:hypothetical protein [Mycolicibacterium novocastrense]